MNVSLPEHFKKSFKDADIRGVYPKEISEVLVYRVARAVTKLHSLKSVAVGRDMRLSSPGLHKALLQGFKEEGVAVLDLGLIPTPVLYHVSGEQKVWGVMITASHNPAVYNGLKIVMPGAVPLTNATGMKDIQKMVSNDTVFIDSKKAKKVGVVTKKRYVADYVKKQSGHFSNHSGEDIRIVACAGNGMASVMLSALPKRLIKQIDVINSDLDGSFPSRGSNPMLKKNQKPIVSALKGGQYTLGVAFDGDGDRVAFFTPDGRMINSAVIGAIIARQLLREKAGAVYIDTVFNSRSYQETVRREKGKVVKARVGHAFIKEKMKTHKALFGCEHSGHFYFKYNYYADSSVLALLYVIQALKEEGGDFKKLLQPFSSYYQTEEVLVEVENKKQTIQSITKEYEAKEGVTVRKFDGITVEFDGVWFALKPSVTEDALKYVVEASTRKKAVTVQKELKELLKKYE